MFTKADTLLIKKLKLFIMDMKKAIEFHNKGEYLKAEEYYLKALEKNPNDAYINDILARFYNQIGNFLQAEKYALIAIENDENPDYMENLATSYYFQKKIKKSMKIFEKVIKKVPNDIQRIRDYASIAQECSELEYAIKFYKKSLAIEKEDYVALNNIGLLYEALKKDEKAKNYYQKSLKIKENYSANYNLGVYYRKNGDYKKSIFYLEKALELEPQNNKAKVSLGMSYLAIKDFKNGYKYYKNRRSDIRKDFKNPWDGSEQKDKTLLIYFDGGRGDLIMFSRYIPYLRNKFKKIICLVFDELKELFRLNFPDVEFLSFDSLCGYDYSVNIMELPYVLNMDFNQIPYSSGYLKANEQKVFEYKKEFFDTDKLKIGLYWQGNLKVYPYRTMEFENLKELFCYKKAQFYSCQKDIDFNLIKDKNVIDLGAKIENFSDTASILKNLDILITIDTAILHLAGALGVKTYLMLPKASEWRWFDDINTTPWYDSVKIFKQEKLYDWKKPVSEILIELNSHF